MTKDEINTAKHELNGYKYLRQKLANMQDYKLKVETQAEKITTTLTGMPVNHGFNSKVEDGAIRLAEISTKYSTMILEVENKKLEILTKINNVPEPYRTLLEQLYIKENKMEKVAINFNWDYYHTCHQHGIALKLYVEKNLK